MLEYENDYRPLISEMLEKIPSLEDIKQYYDNPNKSIDYINTSFWDTKGNEKNNIELIANKERENISNFFDDKQTTSIA